MACTPCLDWVSAPSARPGPKFRARWLSFCKLLSSWYSLRPRPLHAILVVPSSTPSSQLFPAVTFSNTAGITSSQLYHTAFILNLQKQPLGFKLPSLSPKPMSVLWHASGSAASAAASVTSNEHNAAWTNGLQPLWIAGKCVSHREEHKAILNMLEMIERQSGWKTSWRAEDLNEHWGGLG